MRQMSFLSFLQDYLRGHGDIYTVRKYCMPEGPIEVEGVGICQRASLGQIYSKKDLVPYWKCSGFNSLDAWWVQIKKFITTPGPYYLYRVTTEEGG